MNSERESRNQTLRRPDGVSNYTAAGWNHEKLMEYHKLRRLGHSQKTAARIALLGWRKAK